MVKRTRRSNRSRVPAKYRSGGWVGLARKAIRGYKYVKSLLNVERKFFDRYDHTSITPLNDGATLGHLTSVSTGVSASQRTGNSVLAKSLQFVANVKQNGAQTSPTHCRLIIFVDREKPTATVTDLLTSSSIDSNFNINNRDRFRILMDRKFICNVVGTAGADHIIKFYKKLHHHVKYTGTADTNMDEGHIFYLALSDQGANVPTWYLSSRFYYIDN